MILSGSLNLIFVVDVAVWGSGAHTYSFSSLQIAENFCLSTRTNGGDRPCVLCGDVMYCGAFSRMTHYAPMERRMKVYEV